MLQATLFSFGLRIYKEKEMAFMSERFHQKIPQKDDKQIGLSLLINLQKSIEVILHTTL